MEEFRAEVAAFIARSIRSGTACPAFGAILPPHLHEQSRVWQQTMASAGMAGLHWPVEFGGRGLSREHTTVWYEECARAAVSPSLNLQGILLAGEAILRSGTQAQKAHHLPSTLTGETLWCQLFSEPGSGSDLASLRTTATPDGDGFVVNGQKVWSSNAQFAESAILMARTEPDAPAHRGISFFVIDMTLPGIDVRPIKQMTGDHEFCEVFLTDLQLPGDALLGGRGNGWSVAMSVLADERGSFGEAAAITLQREVTQLAEYDVGGDMVLTDRLASQITEGRALISLLHRLGSETTMAPAAKLLRTEFETAAHEIETSIRGAHGMLDGEATRSMLYAPGMRLAGGTSEIQRNIIGERVLGLPKEPKR